MAFPQRVLGSTGLQLSEVGFGCGGTSGLMGRGEQPERRKVVEHALAQGINYFDTAPGYDETRSETNLGVTLKELGAHPIISTKVQVPANGHGDIPAAVAQSVEASLRRLQVDCIDLIQLHSRPTLQHRDHEPAALTPDQILGPNGVADGFERMRDQGKVRYFGFTAIGETAAIHQVIDSGRFHTVQAYFNLLNPSAGLHVPVGFRFHDYGMLIDRAGAQGMGVIVIRSLAAGALSDSPTPHPMQGGWASRATHEVDADRLRGKAFHFLSEGRNQNMAQAALRFALHKPEVSTVLVGFSDLEQVDDAYGCYQGQGILEGDIARLRELYHAD